MYASHRTPPAPTPKTDLKMLGETLKRVFAVEPDDQFAKLLARLNDVPD